MDISFFMPVFDIPALVHAVGYLGIFGIVFAESGLFIGFFLPGDSLLFTAGFLASQGLVNVAVLAPVAIAAAIMGDSVGYAFGKKIGPWLFRREQSMLFRPEYVERTRAFYAAHGSKTIIIARFMPVVRTFAPILAGVGRMHYPTFLIYNIAGGVLWAGGLSIAGYILGSVIPDIDRYLIPIVLGIVALSVLPPVIHWIREKKKRSVPS